QRAPGLGSPDLISLTWKNSSCCWLASGLMNPYWPFQYWTTPWSLIVSLLIVLHWFEKKGGRERGVAIAVPGVERWLKAPVAALLGVAACLTQGLVLDSSAGSSAVPAANIRPRARSCEGHTQF